jgi:phosphoserine phosphatase RsbU/P
MSPHSSANFFALTASGEGGRNPPGASDHRRGARTLCMALLIATGAGVGRQFQIDSDETIIGRSGGLPIVLEGANISRRHARIVRNKDQFFVEDLGSSNGTFVNDRRINGRTSLVSNDLLRIGPYSFRFQSDATHPADLTIHRETAALPGNTEIYRENAAQKLQAVLQLAHDLGSTLEVETLLNRFLDQLLKLFPKTDRALVLFLERGEPVVRLVRDRRNAEATEPLFSRSVLKQAIEKGTGILAEDTRSLDANVTLNAIGVRSLICVPLRAHGTPVFGAVQLDRFRLDSPFTSEDLHLLTAVTLQVSVVLDKAQLHAQLLAQERIARELALAREIQLSFLPQHLPALAAGPLDLIAELHPAEEVSGDFYDYIAIDERRIAFLVADVSGKGMPAALFMSMVRALLRQLTVAGSGPAQILTQLNNTLAADNPKFMFVTIALGIYDVVTGECIIARGGHPAPLLRRADGAISEINSQAGCLIGIAEKCEGFYETTIHLAPREILFFYTDGLTEAAQNGSGPLFGTSRLIETIRKVPADASLSEHIGTMRAEVNRFAGPGGPQDDVTVLLLRHKAAGGGKPAQN